MPSSGLDDQVAGLPGLIAAASRELAETTRLALSTPEHYALRAVLAYGSGDSRTAGAGARLAWESLTGIPFAAEDAMTASRYQDTRRADSRPLSPLVVALSYSGEAARVVEAAMNARARGCRVLAVTASEDSRLAKAADTLLALPPAPPLRARGAPGLYGAALLLLALYHLAVRSGEARGRYTMAEADDLRDELGALAGHVASTAELAAAPAREIASQWAGISHAEILGSGPSRASAAFCAAKVVEAAGVAAYDQDIEEFLHVNYFAADSRIGTLLISPSGGAAHGRALEVSHFLASLGRPVASLSEQPLAGTHLPAAPGVRELWHPLLHLAPAALLAAELMRQRDEVPFRGSTGRWSDSRDAATVRASTIEALTEAP